jgi:hypothetical protein
VVMRVGAPSMGRARDSGRHPGRLRCSSKSRNDIEGAAIANKKLRMSSFAASQMSPFTIGERRWTTTGTLTRYSHFDKSTFTASG